MKQRTIIVLAATLLVVLNQGFIPLALNFTDVTIKVLDSGNNPIDGARVDFDLNKGIWEWFGDVDYSDLTNYAGIIYREDMATGDYILTISKPGYETYTTPVLPFKDVSVSYTFKLQESGDPGSGGHTATFYLRDAGNRVNYYATFYVDDQQYAPNTNGVVTVHDLVSGSHSFRVKNNGGPDPFDWSGTFTMPDQDAVFTVNTDSGIMALGIPGEPPTQPSDWLMENLNLVVLALAAFLVMWVRK